MYQFRNKDGISLVTGAPNVRSLRLWLNQAEETRLLTKRQTFASSSFLDMQAAGEEQETTLLNDTSAETEASYVEPQERLVLHVFDATATSREEVRASVDNNIIDVGSINRGEVYALLENGRVVLLNSGNNMTRSVDIFGSEKSLQSQNQLLNVFQQGSNGIEMTEGIVLIPGDIRWIWSEHRLSAMLPISRICCGNQHAVCVTDLSVGSKLYAWGNNEWGQCGQLDAKRYKMVPFPALVPNIEGPVTEVACGPHYTCCALWTGRGEALYSFGGGVPTSRLNSLLNRANVHIGNASVIHADVGTCVPPHPFFEITPVRPSITKKASDAKKRSDAKPIWSASLSTFIASVHDTWSKKNFSLTQHPTRLDALEGDNAVDKFIELENSRVRLDCMEKAFQQDVGHGVVLGPNDVPNDPAPFEIEKVLCRIQYELDSKQIRKEVLGSEAGFEHDISSLEEQCASLEKSKAVYKTLKGMWEGSRPEQCYSNYDSDVLYAFLEDCRRSELKFLAHEEVVKRKHDSDASKRSSPASVFSLLSISDSILDNVERGLAAFECPDSFEHLFLAVSKLVVTKKERNAIIRNHLRASMGSLSRKALLLKRRALNDVSPISE